MGNKLFLADLRSKADLELSYNICLVKGRVEDFLSVGEGSGVCLLVDMFNEPVAPEEPTLLVFQDGGLYGSGGCFDQRRIVAERSRALHTEWVGTESVREVIGFGLPKVIAARLGDCTPNFFSIKDDYYTAAGDADFENGHIVFCDMTNDTLLWSEEVEILISVEGTCWKKQGLMTRGYERYRFYDPNDFEDFLAVAEKWSF